MDIGTVSTLSAVTAKDTVSPIERAAAVQQAAAERARQQAQDAARAVPRDPAPALRPTIQDRIDITRALLLMRNAR